MVSDSPKSRAHGQIPSHSTESDRRVSGRTRRSTASAVGMMSRNLIRILRADLRHLRWVNYHRD
jgi:hypothetical protein